jgi:hypothetical protein
MFAARLLLCRASYRKTALHFSGSISARQIPGNRQEGVGPIINAGVILGRAENELPGTQGAAISILEVLVCARQAPNH